jgi:hypothetical protein
MRKVAVIALFAFAGATLKVIAADNPQQNRMATCNKEAGDKNLKGDDRKKFMSECLSASKKMTQQEKMAACNKEAGSKNLKGDERKKFMSSCLSG